MAKNRSRTNNLEALLYADSETDSDVLYFGGAMVPDPFIAFSCEGRRVAVLSRLEYARVKKEGRYDEVLSLEAVEMEARKATRGTFLYPGSLIAWLARRYGIKGFRVSPIFPCGPALQLQQLKVRLEVVEGLLFPERDRKTDEEARFIRQGNDAASAGFRVVEKLLREAEIKRGYLYHSGKRLTSEIVQRAISIECLNRGAVASNTIVAGGDQACDPHCRGTGPLRANEFIIVDIFPRVSATGYHGDMTRTYLKGSPSDLQRDLYAAVFEEQQKALQAHRSGRSGSLIYRKVMAGFEERGFPSTTKNGTPVGFIHGLGHGLGLAVHEPPRVNAAGSRLRKGQVITVEPGLYYPGLGGVRVEDVIRVSAGEPELLSKHGYRWHIR
ncbi:MAG: M24 family metallopeptidase [Puniceicoccaceae bacterium]